MDTSQIVIPAALGAVLTVIIPLVTRQTWPRAWRLAVAIALTVIVGGAVTLAWLRPDSWQTVAAGVGAAVAVGQVVYQALVKTGLFAWISAATDPKPAPIEQTTAQATIPEESASIGATPDVDGTATPEADYEAKRALPDAAATETVEG